MFQYLMQTLYFYDAIMIPIEIYKLKTKKSKRVEEKDKVKRLRAFDKLHH